MRLLLRTIWKDTIVLRWWLLAWIAILAGWAVWRDYAAAAWDAAPVNEKPATASTLMAIVLGCAAVLAVRVMHTDALQSDNAFWRTRPTSGLRLGIAKVCFAVLWLIALPAAAEYALLDHWNWHPWLWPCVADWTISVTSVVIPALIAGAILPVPSLAVPLALGLAWLCYGQRPEATPLRSYVNGELSVSFWTLYARILLGIVVTLAAAAGRQGWALGILVLCLFRFPEMRSIRLPVWLDPTLPEVRPLDGVEIEVSSVGSQGNIAAYIAAPGSGNPLWIGPSGQDAIFQPANGAAAESCPQQRFLPQPNEDFGWPRAEEAEAALLISRPARWGNPTITPPDRNTGKPGLMVQPLHYGSLTVPIVAEFPLTPGASWQSGPWRMELGRILRSSKKDQGVLFELRTTGPRFGLGRWQPNMHGSGCATTWRYALVNRRMGYILPLYLNAGFTTQDGFPLTEEDNTSRQNRPSTSLPLHRFDRTDWLNLWPPVVVPSWMPGKDIAAVLAADGPLLRDAVLAVIEWRIVEHGERMETLDPWPPRPRIGRDTPWEQIKPQLDALKLPPLDDETAVRRYIDECLRLRKWLGGDNNYYGRDSKSLPKLDRFTALGPRHFPLLVKRIIAIPEFGDNTNPDDERAALIDILAAEMAQEADTGLLMGLLESGMPLPLMMKQHASFREAAIPRLERVATQFNLGQHWAKEMIAFHDPRLHPAQLAWFRRGFAENQRSIARELLHEPGFPWAAAMEILRSRQWEMEKPARATLALLAATGGLDWGPREAAALFTPWPWPKPDNGFTGNSFKDWLDPFRTVCPACPPDNDAALHWIAENGRSLKWDGKQWSLP